MPLYVFMHHALHSNAERNRVRRPNISLVSIERHHLPRCPRWWSSCRLVRIYPLTTDKNKAMNHRPDITYNSDSARRYDDSKDRARGEYSQPITCTAPDTRGHDKKRR